MVNVMGLLVAAVGLTVVVVVVMLFLLLFLLLFLFLLPLYMILCVNSDQSFYGKCSYNVA